MRCDTIPVCAYSAKGCFGVWSALGWLFYDTLLILYEQRIIFSFDDWYTRLFRYSTMSIASYFTTGSGNCLPYFATTGLSHQRHNTQRITGHSEPVLHSATLSAAVDGCALYAACGPCGVALQGYFLRGGIPMEIGDCHGASPLAMTCFCMICL